MMASARWDPWNELLTMQDRIDRLFSHTLDDSASASGARNEALLTLPVDIRQTAEAFIIEADIPGVGPDDVEVSFQDNTLILRVTRTEERKDDYVRRERRMLSSFRQVALPPDVIPDKIEATFENGVVTVVVPRAERAQSKRIPVQSGASRANRSRLGAGAGAESKSANAGSDRTRSE